MLRLEYIQVGGLHPSRWQLVAGIEENKYRWVDTKSLDLYGSVINWRIVFT